MTRTDGHLLDDLDHRDHPDHSGHPDPSGPSGPSGVSGPSGHPGRPEGPAQADAQPRTQQSQVQSDLLGHLTPRDSHGPREQGGADSRSEGTRRRAEVAEWRDAFAALFDPVTFRHLEGFGVGPGWRCWEVGASGTSIIAWLAKRVGPTGKVMATATDTSWADAPTRPPVEVRVHDVAAQEPPGEGFDLVHARLALGGVADREQAVRTMVGALRPGGRLLLQDTDAALQPLICPDDHGPEQQLANRLRQGVRSLLADHGLVPAHGRTLPRLLRTAGLRQVEADACFPVTSPHCAALESATIRQLRDRLVAAGLATDADIDRHLSHIASGEMDLAAPALISAWGRRA